MNVVLPLFSRFPGTASLPLAGIAETPTPIEPRPASEIAGIGRLLVKRDDLTSPIYGGNKVRKLDFLLGQALSEGRKSVLTFGAYGSNHALATAIHASSLGLEPHVVLSPQEPGPFAPRTLLAHARLGTVIHLTEGWDGRREAVSAIRSLRERDGMEPYVIPFGGTSTLGIVGHVSAALELPAEDLPDVVYVAAGTLGTAVGLALGFASIGARTRIEAIRVTPSDIANEQVAEQLVAATSEMLNGLDDTFPTLDASDLALTVRHEFFDPGYGIVTPGAQNAVARAGEMGLKLETTYTGKAFSAMTADAGTGRLKDTSVVFWDTYSSAPYPEPGDLDALPQVLREYIEQCRRLFPTIG